MNDFMATGGDFYPTVTKTKAEYATQEIMDQVLADYVTAKSPLSPFVLGPSQRTDQLRRLERRDRPELSDARSRRRERVRTDLVRAITSSAAAVAAALVFASGVVAHGGETSSSPNRPRSHRAAAVGVRGRPAARRAPSG